MWSTPKIKPIEPSLICDENQTRQRWIDHISLVYAETKIELLGPISLGLICDDN